MTEDDYRGRPVRLTDERMAHIIRHPEMRPLLDQVPEVLRTPQCVRQSTSDDDVFLYYQWYAHTMVGPKWLCVVVKDLPDDSFVITAYVTDTPKKGRLIYGKEDSPGVV
jgi:hypothetical protein